jgi:hypothetical protein
MIISLKFNYTAFLAIFQRSRHRSAPTGTVTDTWCRYQHRYRYRHRYRHRHRHRHRPAQTGTDRHVPAPNGTDRHRPAQTGTDQHGPAPYRHDINFDYLVVNIDNYQFFKYFFHLNRSQS